MIDYILQADQEILLWIQMYIRHESLTPFFRFITHLGDKGIIWIIISIMLLIRKDTRRAGCHLRRMRLDPCMWAPPYSDFFSGQEYESSRALLPAAGSD